MTRPQRLVIDANGVRSAQRFQSRWPHPFAFRFARAMRAGFGVSFADFDDDDFPGAAGAAAFGANAGGFEGAENWEKNFAASPLSTKRSSFSAVSASGE